MTTQDNIGMLVIRPRFPIQDLVNDYCHRISQRRHLPIPQQCRN